jgi:transcription factor IIIB 90 kDa subunit
LPSAKLTVDEFREIWFQNAADPPSFAKPRAPKAPQIEGGESPNDEDDAVDNEKENVDTEAEEAEAEFLEEMVADRALEDEISRHLTEGEFQRALAEIDALRQQSHSENKEVEEGTLSDLDDDDEVAGAIIDESSEHFILRAQLWMESNRDYLIEQREKRLRQEEDERNGIKKHTPKRRRKTKKTEVDDGESVPATPAESAKQMVKQRAFSKKIDYSAMDRLFADD